MLVDGDVEWSSPGSGVNLGRRLFVPSTTLDLVWVKKSKTAPSSCIQSHEGALCPAFSILSDDTPLTSVWKWCTFYTGPSRKDCEH